MTLTMTYVHVWGGQMTDGHAFTKISRIYSLPFFLTHGASLKPIQTGGEL